MNVEEWLTDVWYGERRADWLAPLGWLGRLLSVARARRWRAGLAPGCRLPVPVVVVGNITAGGTGKTPLVLWLARLVSGAGLVPGILCRGYRGRSRKWPRLVGPDTDPEQVGDEAVLLARRSGAAVAAGPDRCAAGELLLDAGVDIVISDDGLQHLRLERDLEIAVIDGARGLGNGRFIPAGPLRDSPERLRSVDFVVVNGRGTTRWPRALPMHLEGTGLVNLVSQAGPVELDTWRGRTVHAVAGIGHPRRFFDLLRAHGISVLEHPFADHASFAPSDLHFDDELPIVMTEKDAVKVRAFAGPDMWCVPVDACLSADAARRLQAAILGLSGARATGADSGAVAT